MAHRPVLPTDPALNTLCDLLQRTPRRRTPTDYLQIARLVARFRTPGDAWVGDLQVALRRRRVRVSESLLHRFARLHDMAPAFRDAYRMAKRARWEHVRLLLGVEDVRTQLDLLDHVEARPPGQPLPASEFKEIVHLRTSAGAGRPTPAIRAAFGEAEIQLRNHVKKAAAGARDWLDGQAAATLAALAGRDLAAAGRVRAAVRRFRVSADRLIRALERERAPLAGG